MKPLTNFPEELTQEQIEILTGLLLGDVYLIRQKPTHNAHLIIDRSVKDIDYLLLNKHIFNNICTETRKINYRILKSPPKYDKTKYETGAFATRSCPLLNIFHSKWYPNGIKIVPKDLILTPLIVAIWFCDDGYIRLRGKNKNILHLRFCTEGFSKDDNIFIAKLLNEICGEKVLATPLTKKAEKWRITASHKAAAAIVEKIDKYIPECMVRKVKWRNVVLSSNTNPNRKNRLMPSKKDAITLSILRELGPKTSDELAILLNEEFKKNNLLIMTKQYSIKYIYRLYKFGMLGRKLDGKRNIYYAL